MLLCGAIALTALYAFFIGHPDNRTISTWGYDLLMAIKTGQFRDFPAYTYAMHENATNYSLFDNLLTAVCLLPLFLIDMLFHLSLGVSAYALFDKFWMFAAVLFSIWQFGKLLSRLHFSDRDRLLGIFLFLSSAILQITVVGKGQIDIVGLIFLFFAADAFLDERYVSMSLWFGLSILVKPFTVLIALPVLLLRMEKYGWRALYYGILTLVPYAVDVLLRKILMPKYGTYSALTEAVSKELFGATRFEALYQQTLGAVALFPAAVLLLSAICFFKGYNRLVKSSDYLLFPALFYLALAAFMSPTIYWFVSVLPILILLGLYTARRLDLGILFSLMNVGVIGRIYGTEIKVMPSPRFTVWNDVYAAYPLAGLREAILANGAFLDAVFTTVFIGAMGLVLLEFVAVSRMRPTHFEDVSRSAPVNKERISATDFSLNDGTFSDGNNTPSATSSTVETIVLALPLVILVIDFILRWLI